MNITEHKLFWRLLKHILGFPFTCTYSKQNWIQPKHHWNMNWLLFNAGINVMPQDGEEGQTLGILTQRKMVSESTPLVQSWIAESSEFLRLHLL